MLNFLNLSKDEFKKIMAVLPIDKLRFPLTEENKLVKKYASGFRVNSVPLVMLVNLYYNEINSGSKLITAILDSRIDRYLTEYLIIEILKNVNEEISYLDCVRVGIKIGKSGCEIEFKILSKLLDLKLSEEKISLIQDIQNESLVVFKESKEKENLLQEEIKNYKNTVNEYTTKNNSLIRKNEDIENKKKLIDKQVGELNKNINDLNLSIIKNINDLTLRDKEIYDLNLKLKSLEKEKKSWRLEVDKLKKIENNNEKLIKELSDNIKEIEIAYSNLENNNELEFDKTIKKIVSSTLIDINEGYTIDKIAIDKILKSFETDSSIRNAWNYLSKNCERCILEIEESLNNNVASIELIDNCNDIENNLITKYIIIKSIKSLYYEYKSMQEIKNTLIIKNKQ